YTRVGNGISPDILTQLVLNENDTVEFIVSFSEATMTKRGWDEKKTYLMLNNGDKAYFTGKSSDEKRWTFTYTFKSGTAEEASLLKVIALGNDALNGQLRDVAGKQSDANDSYYTYNVDGRTMTDYVGNVMVERANEDASTNNKQIESSISWAGLSVDNTAPSIDFSYGVYGSGTLTQGTESTWGQAAKLGVSAEDPDLPVAKYDPEYAEDNTTRPSKGIYRPDSTTGGATTKSGLIYYVWTRSEAAPATGENYEAIKRYSLTGIQPKDVEGTTYASAWTDLPANLMVANNFSDIVPPESAMTSDGSGAWYLHIWTADMTWDSARQRMQYQKAQAQQYNSGYDNATFIKLQQEMVETYRKGNAPSYNTAWNQVKATFYSTVYSDAFLAWLKESDPTDMYSDAAMDGAVKKATAAAEEGNIYNTGYSEESLSDADDSYKTTVLNEYINQYETTAEDAWPEVKAQVYGKAFTDGFTEWLNEGENDTLTQESTAEEIQALVENYAQNRYPYRAIETTPTEEGEEVTPTYYTAETAAELKAARIQAYIDDPGNEITETVTVAQETQTTTTQETQTTTTQPQTVTRKPTEEEAWAAVRADVYLEVYSTDFLSRLTGISQTDAKYTVTIPEDATEDQITELKNAAIAQFTADLKAALDADITDEEKSTVLTAVAVEAYGFVDEETRYTAETTAELIESSIEDYIANNKPSVAEAWEAKKAEIYETVYTAEYLAQLDATGYDRYSELAIEAVLQSKIQAKIYKNGYTDETAQAKKQELINAYITKNTTSAPKSPTPSYADSWIAVRESVYQTAFTAQFIAWLKEGDTDMYSDAAMLYAKAQAMLAVADYADVVDTTPGPWYLADFRLDDSNWTVNTQRVLLDNTVPEAAVFGAPTGNGTALVEMTSTISDALSGLDTAQVYFQWVKKDYGAAPGEDDNGWTKVEESTITSNTVTDTIDAKTTYGKASATFTVSTLKNVVDDGDYYLYLKYSDVAGNTTIAHSGAVTVNSKYDVKCAFAPAEAITGYYNASFAPVL
ncbi:MAG: hypothetical protein K6G54_08850, partial [Oscillospiraceae bacterium]|nr:hypothetical protein [Oscillospiraceae bacterium]